MNRQEFGDETLVAFADGELDEAVVPALQDALKSDPALMKRLEVFVVTRDRLKSSLGPVANERVPDRLTDFVMRGSASTEQSRPARDPSDHRRFMSRFAAPIAAAIACLIAGAGGYLVGSRGVRDSGPGLAGMTAASEPELRRLLSTSPDGAAASWSTSSRGGEITVNGTYRTRTGFCRSFSVSERSGMAGRAGGVACLGPVGWQTQVIAAERASDGAVAPASSAGQAVDAFLDAAEAGEPLDATAVRELIAKGWN